MVRRGLVVLLLVTATACGSEGGDTDGATAAPTTIALTTTVETTTTAATTTTVPSTTTTTTTLAPTTTVDPLDVLAAEIERDLNLGEQALLQAAGRPEAAESRDLARRHYQGDSLEVVVSFLDALVADGLVGRANPDVPSSISLLHIHEPPDDTEPATAIVEICRIDAGVVVVPPTGTGSDEVIVNDRITRTVSRSAVVLVEGIWLLAGGETLDQTVGATSCVGV